MSVTQRVQAISDLVQNLSENEQNALYTALRKTVLLAKAQKLNNSILPNNIDMTLIISEIQKVRFAA